MVGTCKTANFVSQSFPFRLPRFLPSDLLFDEILVGMIMKFLPWPFIFLAYFQSSVCFIGTGKGRRVVTCKNVGPARAYHHYRQSWPRYSLTLFLLTWFTECKEQFCAATDLSPGTAWYHHGMFPLPSSPNHQNMKYPCFEFFMNQPWLNLSIRLWATKPGT